MNLHKLYIPALTVLAIILLFGAAKYMNERENRVRAEEQKKATEQIIAAKDAAIKDRDDQFAKLSKQFDDKIASINTAQKATTVLQPIIMPNGQAPPPVLTKADLPAAVQAKLPDAPDAHFTLFNDQQMIDLGKAKVACDKTEAGLSTCDADKKDIQAKLDAKTKESVDWEKAAKGGSAVHRTLRVATPLACAGFGAWLASSTHASAKATGIAAAGAGAGCALTFKF